MIYLYHRMIFGLSLEVVCSHTKGTQNLHIMGMRHFDSVAIKLISCFIDIGLIRPKYFAGSVSD